MAISSHTSSEKMKYPELIISVTLSLSLLVTVEEREENGNVIYFRIV